jgi:hypothetical protein
MDIIAVVVGLPLAGWLVLLGLNWWIAGSEDRQLAAFVRKSFAGWQAQIDDARAQLADMQTPGWIDRQWPICEDLQASADGEYCTTCFRRPWLHAPKGV